MADLISRAALLDEFLSLCGPQTGDGWDNMGVRNLIMRQKTVDAVPVKYGRWITNKYGGTVCSECDNNALQVLTGCLTNRHLEAYKSKFCPSCGAKMDGEA